MLSVFGDLQAGRFDVAVLSAAQVDVRGNLNSSVLAPDGAAPRYLVGSGGAHDITTLVDRLVVVMGHDRRRIVDEVDFVTSPRRGGPGRTTVLVTPEARFEATDAGLVLTGVRAGRDPDEVVAELGLDLDGLGAGRLRAAGRPRRRQPAGAARVPGRPPWLTSTSRWPGSGCWT